MRGFSHTFTPIFSHLVRSDEVHYLNIASIQPDKPVRSRQYSCHTNLEVRGVVCFRAGYGPTQTTR